MNFKQYREEILRLNISDAEKLIGLGAQTLGKMESGSFSPSLKNLKAIRDVLHVHLDWLIDEAFPEPEAKKPAKLEDKDNKDKDTKNKVRLVSNQQADTKVDEPVDNTDPVENMSDAELDAQTDPNKSYPYSQTVSV